MKQLNAEQIATLEKANDMLREAWSLIYNIDKDLDHKLYKVRAQINSLNVDITDIRDNAEY